MNMVDVEQKFDAFNQPNIRRFNPVGFAYIQGLYQRLQRAQETFSETKPSFSLPIAEKMIAAIDDYSIELEDAKVNAQIVLSKISDKAVSMFDEAQVLFDTYQFQALEKLALTLKSHDSELASLSLLVALNNDMQQAVEDAVEQVQAPTLDDQLHSYEQLARSSAGCATQAQPQMEMEGFELKSMKHFRESMKHASIDKVINRALTDFPANAGPHNPQMLAMTALIRMQELSPDYLRRFAGYIETVLWLEKNEGKLNRKKSS